MNNHRPSSQKGGFTLAEVLIAVAIASLVLAGVFAIFSQTRMYIHAKKTQADMYQNLRFAVNSITRDAMGAPGYAIPSAGTLRLGSNVYYFVDSSGLTGLRRSATAGGGSTADDLIAEGILSFTPQAVSASVVQYRITGRALRYDRMAVIQGQPDGYYRAAITNTVLLRNYR